MENIMDDAVKAVLKEYDARNVKERAAMADLVAGRGNFNRDEFLLAVGPESGALLRTLAVGAGAMHILELGTSYGYSTMWLAVAAKETGGKVTTCDVAPAKQEYAKAQLTRAGLAEYVTFRAGDALQTIPTLPDGIDFVLVDLWKDLYVPCLKAFLPKLKPGAILVADNMLQPPQAKQDALAYRRAVRAVPGMSSVLLSVGSGLEVSRLKGPLDAELGQ
jgi:predicted O-methyltransferase YrrM